MKKIFTFSILGITPLITSAQVTDLLQAQTLIYDVILELSTLFWSIAVAFFIWGIIKFIKNTEDSAEHEKGKQFMLWGIISFLILVSIWGIVRFVLVDTIGITPGGAPDYIDKNGIIIPT